MWLLLPAFLLFLPIFLLFLLFLLKPLTKTSGHRQIKAGKLPPGPRNLPFIGSIHLLLRRRPAHHIFGDLSLVYGPIMHLRLGQIRTFVISSSEAAKEIMKTHDLAFASRPLTPSVKIICYGGKGIILAPYSDYWRQMRRLCTSELLSPNRVLSFRAIREEEISLFIGSIAASSGAGAAINLSSKFAGLSNNIMTRAVIGGRSEDQKIYLSALGDVIRKTLSFSAVDLFPSMPKFVGLIAGYRLKQCWLKMDRILEKIVKDHREKKTTNTQPEMGEDLTDVLLRKQQDFGSNIQFPLSNDHVKAVTNDMLMAGSETTSTVMEWVMSELVRNPGVMKKAQNEVREVLKGNPTKMIVEEESLSGRLSYLTSVINESLRLHPPVPLLLPRENQEDCEVMGYAVPAGTTVIVNAWAIGRDPKTWSEPDTFRPERFEVGDGIEVKRANFEFIPFGAGRRSCPGILFGMTTIELTLAYMLYYFDWKYVSVKKGEELDMAETLGIAVRRKTQLCLIATPHFPLMPAVN